MGDSPKWVKSRRRRKRERERERKFVKTMAKLRMAHASTHGARKPPGPKIPAIHVDIKEWDRSSITRRYILEQEIFPVAGTISWVEGNIHWGRLFYLGKEIFFVTRSISCSKKYFLRWGIFPALDNISWGMFFPGLTDAPLTEIVQYLHGTGQSEKRLVTGNQHTQNFYKTAGYHQLCPIQFCCGARLIVNVKELRTSCRALRL